MASAHQFDFVGENKSGYSQEVTEAEEYALLPLPPNSPYPKQSRTASYPEPVSQKSAFSRRFSSPRTLKPTAILVVHTLLLAFSWTFFATTANKPVALPVSLAIKVSNNLQSVVWVTSTVASGLALVSSVLYTLAISAMRVSEKSLITNFKRPFWTIGAALCLIAVGQQAPGWSTLLIPKEIGIQSPMTGHELDLKSTAFQNVLATDGASLNTDVPSLVISVTQASGSAAVESLFTPSLLNFNYFSYTNSTRGIMPVSMDVIDNITSITGSTLPPRVDVDKVAETPPGFPASFRLTQQGFTAQVTCQQHTLDNTTQPSLALHPQTVPMPSGATVMSAQLEVLCVGAANSTFSAPVLTSDSVDAVLGVSCPVNQTGGSQRWDLILFGSGIYSDSISTTVCSVFPELNTVNVSYYGDNTKLSDSPPPNFIYSSQPWGGQDAPWLGDFCLRFFLQGLEVVQSSTGNLMGDTVRSFLTNGSGPSVEEILAQYVRGVVEVSVTLLRTAYTDTNTLDPGGSGVIPTNMRSNINGTYWAGTMGWKQSATTAGGVLLAPTLVSLMSILIVVVTLMRKEDVEPEINRYFDPGDLINVISAASAGGVSKVNFQAYDETTAKYRDTVTVTLAHAGEGEPDTKSSFIGDDA